MLGRARCVRRAAGVGGKAGAGAGGRAGGGLERPGAACRGCCGGRFTAERHRCRSPPLLPSPRVAPGPLHLCSSSAFLILQMVMTSSQGFAQSYFLAACEAAEAYKERTDVDCQGGEDMEGYD